MRCAFAPFAHKTTLGRRKNRRRGRFGASSFGAALWYFMSAPRFFGRPLYRSARLLLKLKLVWWRSNHFPVTCYFRFGVKLLSILILRKITGFSPYLTMAPKKKLRVIDTNQRKITSMLQQGPELTQDAPASVDSESAEPENPSEMPEPPDVDMTETDASDGSSEMRKFQLHSNFFCSFVEKIFGQSVV